MKDHEDIAEELAAEHRSLGRAVARIQALPPGDPRRRACLKRTAVTLAGHAVAVERVLQPAVHRHLPGADQVAAQSLTDLVRAEEVMKDLEFTDTGSGEFDPLLRRLQTWLRRHRDHEEAVLLPDLGRAVPPGALDEMGDDVHAVEADTAALREAVAHTRRPDVMVRAHTALTERHPAPPTNDHRPGRAAAPADTEARPAR
ncbi:hemerythrin domain-containing protein [Streptomyces mexicanus]|uniref:Hemerythrin domain-containing protein n=1 Tax=Streptomyces mexicanus TaxID=178566 RepID=A0A7X1I1S9_9ACTN|nr:hemerythrin domain-containing protein [Streptomyces mexicanus]MBC2867136.1 hemerythrin domain-containing protein [Streptomyces mexicanus]